MDPGHRALSKSQSKSRFEYPNRRKRSRRQPKRRRSLIESSFLVDFKGVSLIGIVIEREEPRERNGIKTKDEARNICFIH